MSYGRDLAERIIRTFMAAAFAAVAASISGIIDWDSAKALLLSAMAAGFSAAIGLLAKTVGDPQSASFWSGTRGETGDHAVPADLLQLHEALEADDQEPEQ
jgi:hypothetical protein